MEELLRFASHLKYMLETIPAPFSEHFCVLVPVTP